MSQIDRRELAFWLSDETTQQLLTSCRSMFGEAEETHISDDVFGKHPKSDGGKYKISADRWFRVRRTACSWDVALEQKTYKRRGTTLKQAIVPFSDLPRLENDVVDDSWVGLWFQRQIGKRKLRPTLRVNFHRTAFDHTTLEGPIRLTVDCNFGTELIAGPRSNTREAFEIRHSGNMIRMKYAIALPACFKHLLYDFSLLPDGSDRYARYLQAHSDHQLATWNDDPRSNNEVPACQIG